MSIKRPFARHRRSPAAVWAALLLAGTSQAAEPSVHVVLKFLKARAAAGPVAALDLSSCPACLVRHDPEFERDNVRETLVELEVPAGRYLELAFKADPGSVRRVTLETSDLTFRQQGGRLLVPLPPLEEDAVDAGELATHVLETGMVLRLEHADPERLAGAYGGKPLPAVERGAANNLEFAEREALRELGLGTYVARQRLGVIEVMGFDTNDPHGHLDTPPHIHMHLRWPFNTGTQIGHLFISPQGLLLENRVGVTRYGLPTRLFTPGQTFTTLDNQGNPVFAQTITSAGALRLASVHPDQPARSCLIRPEGPGFQDGAVVECDAHDAVTLHVSDDLPRGVLRVQSDTVTEVFRYDPDTGRLLSPSIAPPVPESAVLPTAETTFTVPNYPSGSGPSGGGGRENMIRGDN